MEEEIDFEATDNMGRNCVILACREGDLKKLKYFVERGGKKCLDVIDRCGFSCLYNACYSKQIDVVKYLLDGGADPNGIDKYGNNCLHAACYGMVEIQILEMVLNAGAHIDVQSRSGNTPFIYACRFGDRASIKLMLDKGADWRLKNKKGQTGLVLAQQYHKRKEVVVWLEEYLNKIEISIERCRKATINVLCVGKRKEEMKTLNLNKDVINIIAKMLWKTRREAEVWV